MNVLVLLRGVPGSGKSTTAKELFPNYTHLEADIYWYDEQGNYNFDITKLHQAHQWCEKEVETAMDWKLNVVVSNTLTTEKELKPYYELAEKYNYTVFSLIVENRHGGTNVHNVPEETLDKMEKRFSIKLR
jgi:predicted kinase